MNPDWINGSIELIGAYFTWMNAWKLYKDREIKGVYWPTMVFFTIWGVWNLYYYPALDQWFSFMAGIVLVLGNAIWVALAIRMKYFNKEQCAKFYKIKYGIYLYCVKQKGHSGNCKSNNGSVLTGVDICPKCHKEKCTCR